MLVKSATLTLPTDEAALPVGTPLILWNDVVEFNNIASTSEADGYPITNVSNPATNQVWRSGSTNSPPDAEEITITTGSSELIDAVGIARHNLGTQGITVEVGYYNTADSPAAWVSLAGPTTPTDDEPLLFWFTGQVLTTVTIKLSSGMDTASIAVIYCGKLLVMERGVDVTSDYAIPTFARRTEFYNARSENGDYLGRIASSQFIDGVEHSFSNMHSDWFRTYIDPFLVRAQGEDTPFFYCFAPDDYPLEVVYAWLTDDPLPLTNSITRRTKVVLKMGGIVE